MKSGAPLPILQVRPSDLASHALVVGDPARAAEASQLLVEVERVGANREYVTYAGRFEGLPITISSHGIGAAGAAVCFEELARGGVKTFIRAGTCGAIDDSLDDGDLVIATAAVRDEGVTPRLVPKTYPAVAALEVSAALAEAAAAHRVEPSRGIVLTTDLFYPGPLGPIDWQLWRDCGVLSIEMEMAALYVVASLHGGRAGGILAVDGNPSKASQDMSEYDPNRPSVREGTAKSLRIALEALLALA